MTNIAGPGASVPGDMICGFCKKPVAGQFYRTMNRFACESCAQQAREVIDRNSVTPESFAKAVGVGLLVALGCGLAWAAIIHITNFEIGIVASFIGVAVAKAIVKVSGKRRGPAMQWLAAVLSIVGVFGGKVMLIAWQIVDELNKRGTPADPARVLDILVNVVTHHASEVFRGFDLLWAGIAVYAAWRLCKALPLTLAGPYPLPARTDDTLQFHTIEPAAQPAAPEQT
jgi:hypothetical protein